MNTPALPDPAVDLARRIIAAAGPKAVLNVAGGGTEVFPWLLARGGGSATLLSGRIPYDPADFRAILGVDPGRLVDARAARGLAMAAFRQAVRLRPDLDPAGLIGIGATSKLAMAASVAERTGRDHEIHLALQTADRTLARSIVLPPAGDRVWQERINALAILNLLAEATGLAGVPLAADGLAVDPDRISEVGTDAASCGSLGIPALLAGRVAWQAQRIEDRSVLVSAAEISTPPTRLILPGSFRPLHAGHLRMAEIAADLVGEPCAFELSVFHPEKPPLDYLSIADRVGRFAGVRGWLLLTDAPTYLDKARLFPGSTFVVGHDTAVRIVEPRWYGGIAARDAMLDELEALGVRLLVFGRVDHSGRFRDLDADTFDNARVARFVTGSTTVIAESRFRSDLSSTWLRSQSPEELP